MKFAELVDIDELKGLCESYTAITGAVTAILELDGTILIATGWQDICTCFHRVNAVTASRCRESDTILAGGLNKGKPYNIYKCKNGLVDVAVPIIIRGEHVANFFTGQFFTEEPDREYFIRQAEEFGFEMDSYLEALQRVPIFSEETIKARMEFFTRLAQLIGEMGLAREELLFSNEKLLQNRNMLTHIINSIPQSIFWKDQNSVYLGCNQIFAHEAGLDSTESIIGKNDFDLPWSRKESEAYRADDREVMDNIRAKKHIVETQRQMNGRVAWLDTNKIPLADASGTVIGLLGVYEDITERKRAEEEKLAIEKQLQQTQKLESLGVLAGGIAHDFNNILMTIIGNADLALMRINKESPVVNNLNQIEAAADKAADLAKQMLAYSGKGKFIIDNIDLNRLLEEMVNMLQISISKKAVLRLNLHEHLPTVEADVTQMRQVVMNLVINASEAIGDKSGVIAITTDCMDCDSNYLKKVWLDDNILEGLYVYLEIADTGCGMDKDTISKLFDPFFTTKFTGRGLGLAAVLGIIRGHKGAIKVYSEPKKGTTFKILLPAGKRPEEVFNVDANKDNWKGSGTVLLVDDEETVRGVGKEMLQELGFTTITARDGREAFEIFKNTPDIALVIMDLTMPHMDGEQCFRELKKLYHDVKVIMCSGYNEQEVSQKFAGKGLAGFIQKPYKLSDLKEAIRKLEG
jgi:PAS domain S-box-containing protein